MHRFYRPKGSTQFNCFSPPVMLATLIIEFSLAAYTLWRYKISPVGRLIALSLVMLATFQVAEYFVCTGFGLHAGQWSRIGFAAIATLPALGLHIFHHLANKPSGKLVAFAYSTMVCFMAFFLLYAHAFKGQQCTGNYVIFQVGNQMAGVFSAYYYGWLLVGIVLGLRWAHELKALGVAYVNRLHAVRALIVGYLVFLLPTIGANTVRPETISGIPSIMCGFAVIFALIMALYILPRVAEKRYTPTKS